MGDLTVAEASANYAWQRGRVGFFVVLLTINDGPETRPFGDSGPRTPSNGLPDMRGNRLGEGAESPSAAGSGRKVLARSKGRNGRKEGSPDRVVYGQESLLFVRFDWYVRIGERLLAAVTISGTMFAVAGVFVLRRRRDAMRIAVALGAGVGVLLAAFPWHAHDHHYYLLFVSPLTALLGGLALDSIRRALPGRIGLALVVALALVVPATGVPAAVGAMRSVDARAIRFGEAATMVIPDDALLIVSAPVIGAWDASLLYRSERRGWRYSTQTLDEDDSLAMARLQRAREERRSILPGRRRVPFSVSREHLLTPEAIERLRTKGASFFAYAGPLERLQSEKPDVAKHLAARYPLIRCDEIASFFDLR